MPIDWKSMQDAPRDGRPIYVAITHIEGGSEPLVIPIVVVVRWEGHHWINDWTAKPVTGQPTLWASITYPTPEQIAAR